MYYSRTHIFFSLATAYKAANTLLEIYIKPAPDIETVNLLVIDQKEEERTYFL